MKTNDIRTNGKKRRGAPLKGVRPRRRYNVTLDPDLVQLGKRYAVANDVSFSELLEEGLKKRLSPR